MLATIVDTDGNKVIGFNKITGSDKMSLNAVDAFGREATKFREVINLLASKTLRYGIAFIKEFDGYMHLQDMG